MPLPPWLLPGGLAFFEPAPNDFQDLSASLFCRHAGIVHDDSAEGDHERRGGTLAIALVARCQVFLDTIGLPASGSFLESGVEVKLEVGLGKHVGANVATFHDQAAELDALSLGAFHPFAHFGN